MIEASLIKSNFVGRDGFKWWVGQIPLESAHGSQINGEGWGNRFKVRIMGYHPYNTTELPNEDLPWAQCLLPTTSGTGAGNQATSVKISPGDVVFGFFLDGDNAQIPIILGAFGRTSQVFTGDWSGPFQPFTGYTDKVKKPNGTLKADQSLESTVDSQKSPRNVSPSQAKKIGFDEISFYSAIGDTIQFANTVENTIFGKIGSEVDNLINFVNNIKSTITEPISYVRRTIERELNRVTTKITTITNKLVGDMINGLYKYLIPVLNKGLDLLYKKVFATVLSATGSETAAHKAGVAAQTAMVIPVKALQDAIPCVAGSILNSLKSVVKNILSSVLDNITRFTSCVSDQFTGSLVNDIISKVSSGLSGTLDAIQPILQFFPSFSVSNFFRNTSSALKGLVGMFACNQSTDKAKGICNQWVIGKGPKYLKNPDFDNLLKVSNKMDAVTAPVEGLLDAAGQPVKDFTSTFNSLSKSAKSGQATEVGDCYGGEPKLCGPPTINIFGGDGGECSAVPLFGSIVGSGNQKTGSIIGIKLTNSGSGYTHPPFVEVVDECNQGYGCVARALLGDNGEVDSIYIVSEGENYTIEKERNYVIDDIVIVDPGRDYKESDIVTDDLGNEYKISVYDGTISKVVPLNTDIEVSDYPILTVKSSTGSGALLYPILTTKEEKPSFKEPISSIDCVT